MSGEAVEHVEPRPAATVVLIRPGPDGPEVLLTHRPASMAFAGDMHVFPGGAVDPADADPRLVVRSAVAPREALVRLGGDPAHRLSAEHALALHIAAIRELFEEAGVLLADRLTGGPTDTDRLAAARAALLRGETTLAEVAESLDLRLRTDLLAPISHWTTPPIMPRRFDTRFFVAELPAGAKPTFTTDEVLADRWLTPTAALDAMAAGEIGLWPPTSATLQQLEHVRSFGEVRERLAPGLLVPPRAVVESAEVERIVFGAAGGVPGQTVNCYLVGRRELVVVDPGDPSDEAAEAILTAAERRGGRVAAIAVTHVDPDHAAGAEPLASRLGLRVIVGPGGGRVFSGEVEEAGDGQRIGAGDVELTVVATPGPRPDHVAFLIGAAGQSGRGADGSEPGADVLIGDLVGGRGSRSIFGPPDEAAWEQSVARLAGVHPRRIFPGHGEPLGPEALSAAAGPPGSAGN
ncbi:MAG TPA: MBL fold metallo-hydrolase [Candidatus Dormibacteraeota bacterium]|nr:MBL fold metallo-hydrolase [Candidatus Dormibacteraeota bacterium]